MLITCSVGDAAHAMQNTPATSDSVSLVLGSEPLKQELVKNPSASTPFAACWCKCYSSIAVCRLHNSNCSGWQQSPSLSTMSMPHLTAGFLVPPQACLGFIASQLLRAACRAPLAKALSNPQQAKREGSTVTHFHQYSFSYGHMDYFLDKDQYTIYIYYPGCQGSNSDWVLAW